MTAPLLECVGVACGHDGKAVLESVDLRVDVGEIVVLLGGSGCGKSTLLRTMTGLLPPLAGEVRLFGEPLYALDGPGRNRLLRRTGMLFQQDALFAAMSLLENVALPLRELTQLPEDLMLEMARMKLALVGLAGFEGRRPESLSGGQRKRAALARASVLDPELIFCDEPSAGLDPVVAAGLDQTLRQFRSVFGITIIAVTHELQSIRAIADRAVMLGGGGVLATGTIDELAASADDAIHGFFHRQAAAAASARGDAVEQLRHAR